MIKKTIILLIVFVSLMNISCKKPKTDPRVPPDVKFKTGTGFTVSDITIKKNDTLKVGITSTKTEDNLKSYNVSYAYDGASSTTNFFNYFLQESEYSYYEKDIQIISRNQNGTERWVFSIVDRDGNLTQKTIVLTVQ